MAEYISRDDALLHSEIIRVYSKDYGNIDVVPVEYLADIPAADVQLVKSAKWVLFAKDCMGRAFYCSNCHKVTTTEDFEKSPLENEEYFCPRCGANMRGDTNE